MWYLKKSNTIHGQSITKGIYVETIGLFDRRTRQHHSAISLSAEVTVSPYHVLETKQSVNVSLQQERKTTVKYLFAIGLQSAGRVSVVKPTLNFTVTATLLRVTHSTRVFSTHSSRRKTKKAKKNETISHRIAKLHSR